jgi:single-strand DNA-binding protein
MSDLNRVCLSGRVATEPELRTTKGGTPVVSFVFASNRTWRDERGDRQQDALFLPVEVYGARAEALGQHRSKGSFLLLEGSLRLNQWERTAGQRHSRVVLVADRVVFGLMNGTGQPQKAAATVGSASEDEDLPFC